MAHSFVWFSLSLSLCFSVPLNYASIFECVACKIESKISTQGATSLAPCHRRFAPDDHGRVRHYPAPDRRDRLGDGGQIPPTGFRAGRSIEQDSSEALTTANSPHDATDETFNKTRSRMFPKKTLSKSS